MSLSDPQQQQDFPTGLYLIKFAQRGVVREGATNESQISTMVGELEFEIETGDDGSAAARLRRLGLGGSAVRTAETGSGRISVRSEEGDGVFEQDQERARLDLDITGELVYEWLQREALLQGIEQRHTFNSPRERVLGTLRGIIAPATGEQTASQVGMFTGELNLSYDGGGAGLLQSLRLDLDRAPVFRLSAPAEFVPPSLGSQAEGMLLMRASAQPALKHRQIRIQPVAFRSNAQDLNHTGRRLNTLLNAANALWGQGCIHFVDRPIHIITDNTLKASNDFVAIIDSFVVLDDTAQTSPGVIEVFFVDDPLTDDGGGFTVDGNTTIAKVIVSALDLNNPQLLAHELGHVLSLSHPGEPETPGYTRADGNTVMQSGAVNPDHNSFHNCFSARNPVISTDPDQNCLAVFG